MIRNIVSLLIILISFSATAQEVYTSSGRPLNQKKRETRQKGFDPSRLVTGGGLQLSFGNVTAISVSPILGYQVTDHFIAGIGLGYQYLKAKDYFALEDANGRLSFYDYKSNMISPSVWMRYLILDNLFVHAEYEHNFMSFQDYRFAQNGSGMIEGYKRKYNAPSVLLGAGYRQVISNNASVFIMAVYDVVQDKYSPYYGRIFPKIGFNIGL